MNHPLVFTHSLNYEARNNDYIILAGTVFEADTIARDVWSGVERGNFLIHHGFDGFMLANLTAGMSPVHSIWDATTQVWYEYNKIFG